MNTAQPTPALDHARYMRIALDRTRVEPVALFQSLIVDRVTGEILAGGHNDIVTDHPLVHGETNAIDNCWRAHPGLDWSRLALYTTAEPCPMCQSAIGWAGISLVVYGVSTPFLASLGFHYIDIRAHEVAARTTFNHCEVIGGVLQAECEAVFRAWRAAHPPS